MKKGWRHHILLTVFFIEFFNMVIKGKKKLQHKTPQSVGSKVINFAADVGAKALFNIWANGVTFEPIHKIQLLR